MQLYPHSSEIYVPSSQTSGPTFHSKPLLLYLDDWVVGFEFLASFLTPSLIAIFVDDPGIRLLRSTHLRITITNPRAHTARPSPLALYPSPFTPRTRALRRSLLAIWGFSLTRLRKHKSVRHERNIVSSTHLGLKVV